MLTCLAGGHVIDPVNNRDGPGDIWMRDIPAIPLSIVPQRIYWWPWLKNYYGSFSIQDDCNFAEMMPYAWIDEGLKKEMGY